MFYTFGFKQLVSSLLVPLVHPLSSPSFARFYDRAAAYYCRFINGLSNYRHAWRIERNTPHSARPDRSFVCADPLPHVSACSIVEEEGYRANAAGVRQTYCRSLTAIEENRLPAAGLHSRYLTPASFSKSMVLRCSSMVSSFADPLASIRIRSLYHIRISTFFRLFFTIATVSAILRN